MRMREFAANAIYLAAVFALVITTVTVLFCRQILTAMGTPQDCFEQAYEYIVIIFAGPCGDDPPPAQTDAVTAPAELVLPEERNTAVLKKSYIGKDQEE